MTTWTPLGKNDLDKFLQPKAKMAKVENTVAPSPNEDSVSRGASPAWKGPLRCEGLG